MIRSTTRSTTARILARVGLAIALTLAIAMALLPNPPALPIDRFGDKAEHMLAFGTLTILAVAAYPAMPLHRVGERLSFLGALIEVFQSIPALHRDCDIRDWLADTMVIVGVLLVVALARRVGRAAP